MTLGKTGLQQLNTTEPLEALRYRLLREAERGVQRFWTLRLNWITEVQRVQRDREARRTAWH